MYIYEEKTGNLYVHHDIMLSAFPICLEWLPIVPSSFSEAELNRGNFGIVGSFLPHIEIWDLDVLDPVEPKIVLQGVEDDGDFGTKKKKKAKKTSLGHSGAVTSLSLNKIRK